MQFQINKSSLLKAISNVIGAIEKKSTIPVLQNLKITAKTFDEGAEFNLSLCATDMDITLETQINAEDVTSGGVTTVSAQTLFDSIRKIPDGLVTITQDNPNFLQIKSGKLKYNLPCIDAKEFPVIAEGTLANSIKIDAEILSRMIDDTKFAISSDPARYNLSGIFLQTIANDNSETEVRAVATDGHRLSLSFSSTTAEDKFGVIIPRKAAFEIRKLIEGKKEISISVSDVKIKVQCGETTILSKLIDGEFPPYDRVLPKNNDQIALVNRQLLIDAIERVSTVATDKHRSIKLSFADNKIILQANSEETGSAQDEIDINYGGNHIDIGFNAKYLLDIIEQIGREEIIIKFRDSLSPAVVESQDLSAVFVIMPIRV